MAINDHIKYIIQKQRFQKSFDFPNVMPISYKWPVKVNAWYESYKLQQKVVEWDITVKFVQRGPHIYLDVEGEVTGFIFRLDKCYCRIDVLNRTNEIVATHKEHMNEPFYDKFNFINICNLTELSKVYPNLYHLQAVVKSPNTFGQGTSFGTAHANAHANAPGRGCFGATPNLTGHFGATPTFTETTNTLLLTLTIGASQKKDRSLKPVKRMLDEAILPDMIIKTKTHDYPCHKFILATYSEYFRAMFQANMKENRENIVDWVDVFDSETVKDLLHFFYTGQTPPNIHVTFPNLVETAHLCLLDELKDICSETLVKIINVDNAGSILEVAEKFEMEILKEKAVVFVANHYDEVLDTRGFENIDTEIKIKLNKFLKYSEKSLKPNGNLIVCL